MVVVEYSDEVVTGLSTAIEQIVNRGDASISIRDSDGRFLWVNGVWENNFHLPLSQVKGKTLDELNIYSVAEVAASNASDELLKQKKSIVETVTYGPTTKVIVIRSLANYRKNKYRITIAFNSVGGYVVPTAYGWDPTRADHVLGEIIALRLQVLGEL